MPRVRKAVIPAAGFGTRQYPASSGVRKEFFPLVDRDGRCKAAIQLVVEEALAAVEEACIVCQPGAAADFRRYFSAMPDEWRPSYAGKEWAYQWSDELRRMGERLTFVDQPRQEGLGHAVWCAREWVAGEPFLVVLGDHVFVSHAERRCSVQLVAGPSTGSVTALIPIPEDEIHRFGVVRGRPVDGNSRLVQAEGFIEKPDVQVARELCRVEGVPEGHYLAHLGMHVFTPAVLDVLDEMVRAGRRESGEFQLTAAQDILCRREPYCGLVIEGSNFDIGTPVGMLEAQMALALAGRLRPEAQRMWSRLSEEIEGP